MPRTNFPKSKNNSKMLQDQFRAYSRSPFTEVLARLVDCEPEPARLQDFANQYPDRWASAIKTMAGLAGYHDHLEITGNITIELAQMGDAQLLMRLEEVKQKLLALDDDTIDGQSQEVDVKEESTIRDLTLVVENDSVESTTQPLQDQTDSDET